MATLKAGDAFPDGVVFSYIEPTPETKDVVACGIPQTYKASEGERGRHLQLLFVIRLLLAMHHLVDLHY